MEPLFNNLRFDIWPIGLVLLIVPIAILLHKKRSLYYIFCVSIFGIYLLYAIQQIFFPIEINGDYSEYMRHETSFMSSVNFIPFYFGPFGTLEGSLKTIVLNIILTVPFGFGINFVAPVRAKHFLWIAPAIGLGLETVQLIISLMLRYPYRLIDINDVLMNTLGVLVGYGIFRAFGWLYLWASQQLAIEHGGLGDYIYDVIRLRTAKSSD